MKYYAQRARLPGFRPGKAPDAVVRKRFNDAIRQTVLEEVLRESWETAKTAESLKPITDPSIRNLKFEEGSPIEFELLVEVRPEIKLERVGGFRVERRVAPVTDAAVDEQLARLQEQKARLAPGRPGEQPAPGQMVRVEVAPLEDGEARRRPAVRPGAGAEPGHPRAGRADHGAPARRERRQPRCAFPTITRTSPAGGRAAGCGSTLHEVKRQELPPLDDAFAREVGDFENLDALCARPSARTWSARPPARPTPRCARQLLRQIIEANRVEAPHSLVHRLLHGYAEMYRSRRSSSPGSSSSSIRSPRPQVKRDLVLDALVEAPGASGHRGRAGRADRAAGRGAGRAGRRRSTPRCRRPTGSTSWSGPSPRRRRSSSSSRSPPLKRSRLDDGHPVSALHHRAFQPRRADLRHLLPAADGPDRVPRRADQRRRLQHHHRPAALPRGGQPRQRHLPLHQLARAAWCRRAWRSTTRCSTCGRR